MGTHEKMKTEENYANIKNIWNIWIIWYGCEIYWNMFDGYGYIRYNWHISMVKWKLYFVYTDIQWIGNMGFEVHQNGVLSPSNMVEF